MQVTIETRTPLWTGGVEGKMDRIHETSLIGSLRWWYEAIVRGLGGHACDPSNHECPGNDDNYCDVCQVFGNTGERRSFRMAIVKDQTKSTSEDRMINIRPPGRNRGWFLPPGRMGKLTLLITGDEQSLNLLAALFLFLEKWGTLGAKSQLGYGVFEIVNRDEVKIRAARHPWSTKGAASSDQNLPDIRHIGFFRYHFRPEKSVWWTQVPGIERVATQVQPLVTIYETVPVAPALKNEWRFRRWQGNRSDEMWMFGTLQWRKWIEKQQKHETVRLRSKVSVSWAYKEKNDWEVRGFAWLQKRMIAIDVWNLMQDETGLRVL